MTPISSLQASPLSLPKLSTPIQAEQGASFKNVFLESIEQVNSMQKSADQAVNSLLTGGDVNPAEADEIAGRRTPVPGGVGLLTVAMLMRNTLKAARLRTGEKVKSER